MSAIEEAKKYLSLIPDDFLAEPNQMIEAIQNLITKLEAAEKVIDANRKMFFSEVDINKFGDTEIYLLREALKEYEDMREVPQDE